MPQQVTGVDDTAFPSARGVVQRQVSEMLLAHAERLGGLGGRAEVRSAEWQGARRAAAPQESVHFSSLDSFLNTPRPASTSATVGMYDSGITRRPPSNGQRSVSKTLKYNSSVTARRWRWLPLRNAVQFRGSSRHDVINSSFMSTSQQAGDFTTTILVVYVANPKRRRIVGNAIAGRFAWKARSGAFEARSSAVQRYRAAASVAWAGFGTEFCAGGRTRIALMGTAAAVIPRRCSRRRASAATRGEKRYA